MKIEFTKDFATRSKGTVIEIDSMLGRQLINRKVAKIVKPKVKNDATD